MDSFYTVEELRELGFKSVGKNVKISRKTSLYNTSMMEIGNDARVDDFCIISGKVVIGNNVHIAAYVGLYGGRTGIYIRDFVGISAQSLVYAETDDYSGAVLTNPTIEDRYKNVIKGEVVFGKHSLLGAGGIVLPNVVIGDGCSFGAMSLVSKSTEPWGIYVGSPCRRIRDRKKNLLEIEKLYVEDKLIKERR